MKKLNMHWGLWMFIIIAVLYLVGMWVWCKQIGGAIYKIVSALILGL